MNALKVLGIVFVVLKLTGTVAWSWLIVLAPFWVPIALVGAFLFLIFLGILAAAAVKALPNR